MGRNGFGFTNAIFYIRSTMKATSPISQTRLKNYQKLTQKKYRQAERKYLVEGIRLVEEALTSNAAIEAVIINSEFLKEDYAKDIIDNVKKRRIDCFEASEKDFNYLSDTVATQGIIGVIVMNEPNVEQFWNNLPKKSLLVALDDISDPGNVGTIIRSCDWFGVEGVFLNKNTVELYNPKVVRSTMGSIFHIPIFADVDLPRILHRGKEEKFSITVSAVSGGKRLSAFEMRERCLLVLGNEIQGVSSEVKRIADEFITIPQFGKAESLNVGVACGVILGKMRI